jgi:hypothetical protein
MQHSFLLLPGRREQQYSAAMLPEVASLLLLHCSTHGATHSLPHCSTVYTLDPPITPAYIHSTSHNPQDQETPQMVTFSTPCDSTNHTDSLMHSIASDAVTFSCWKLHKTFNTQEQLNISSNIILDHFHTHTRYSSDRVSALGFTVQVYSYGRKLSKKQKTKLLKLANFPQPHSLTQQEVVPLCLVLVHSPTALDEHGLPLLLRIHVCSSVKGAEATTTLPVSTCSDSDHSSDTVGTSATSLRNVLCKLTCNLALVQSTSLCLDLFCGTGRLMQSMSGVTIGSDAVHHFPTMSVRECASKGQSPYGMEFCLANVYSIPYVAREQFDCIVCDPPYGRREVHVSATGSDAATHTSNHERALAQFEILTPLLHAASKLLRVGGRLVFLFIK